MWESPVCRVWRRHDAAEACANAARLEVAAVREASASVEGLLKEYAQKAADTHKANRDLTTKLRCERERRHHEMDRVAHHAKQVCCMIVRNVKHVNF